MIIREKVRIGDQLVTLETGRIAKQAGGSCLVRAGDTIVLVTVCGNQEAKVGQSFFPLSVEYQEKTYAAGKIPGGFFKREGKLRDYEVLTSRLIDRPCRPLFPEGYLAEVQIVATVMSFDNENPPDTLAMIGASAALHVSQIPWKGPIAGVRVGRVDGEWIANPTFKQIEEGDCELIIAASRDAIVMVEGECEELSEDEMVEALFFGHKAVQATLDLIDRMQQAVGKTKWTFAADSTPQILKDRVRQVAGYKVREACNIANKHERADRFKAVRKEALEVLIPEFPDQVEALKASYEDLKYTTMRMQVLEEGRRLDGRDTRTVRPISIELGVLPRVHGSSLFTRGETQAIVTTTLGTARDQQRIDTLRGDEHKRFMLHYNFPPYSVGECKPMRGPGRREVGHGNLAERALAKMIPTMEEFPYSLRLVSEITESNGSSSMASVCGGSLALMEAGVPLKAPVAGVAMGLIKEGERYAVLTDILGDEDALGDMDFKVCGTDKGITAIQMDIKIEGLSREILERALRQAREGRLHILGKMAQAITEPREELSRWAPRITQIRVKPDQVRTIIGPGGKMIRAIVDQTGASIDVEDDGTVSVSSADSEAVKKALEIIKSLTTEPEIGEVYEGTVKRIEPYGAFIEILPGKDGLCHISDIDYSHVQSVEEFMNLGDKVTVKVTNIDRDGRIRLSRKEALPEQPGGAAAGASKMNGRGDREDRPRRGGDRDERPSLRAREDRPRRDEDRAGRGEREERSSFKGREEREDKPREDRFKPRDEKPREERAAFKPREEREDKPREDRFKPRDEKPRDEKPREERAAFKGRDERDEKPREDRFKPRDEKPREDRFKARDEARDEKPRARSRDEEPRARDRDDRFARGAREDRFERDEPRARNRDEEADTLRSTREEAPRRGGRDFEREERKPAREERKPVSRDEDRFESRRDERKPARDDERKPARDDDRPRARSEEREERSFAKPRDDRFKPRDEERPALKSRSRDDDFDAPRPRDREEAPRRGGRDFERDEARPSPRRDEERAASPRREARDERPRGRDDEPRRREDRDEPRSSARRDDDERPARARKDDDRFERSRESDVLERKPARGRDADDRDTRSARDDRDDDRGASSAREREDRTERERPSRMRARARTRERVREVERERERR